MQLILNLVCYSFIKGYNGRIILSSGDDFFSGTMYQLYSVFNNNILFESINIHITQCLF